MPVTVDGASRASGCPAPVETAAYFVVSEALTNVAKYAQASTVAVGDRSRRTGFVTIEVNDDGVGGADASQRLGPARSRRPRRRARRPVASRSPAGGGTRLQVEIPCVPQAADASPDRLDALSRAT